MQKSLELKDILRLIRRYWRWMVIGILAGAILGIGITTLFIQEKYTANVKLYIYSKTLSQSEDYVDYNINDLNTSIKLINNYKVVLKDNSFLEDLASNLSRTVTAKYLNKAITLASATDTTIIDVTVTTENAEFSAEICEIISELAPTVFVEKIEAGTVKTFGKVQIPTEPSSPNLLTNTALAAFVGLAVVAIIVLLIYFLDNTIKGEEEIKQLYNLPILGEVPSSGGKNKKKKRRNSNYYRAYKES